MRICTSLFFVILFGLVARLDASELIISNPNFYFEQDRSQSEAFVSFTVSWKNAWHNDRNHDAIWLFAKFQGQNGWPRHARLAQSGHRVQPLGNAGLKLHISPSEDGIGAFLIVSANYRGDINAQVTLQLDTTQFADFNPRTSIMRVYGTEMVFIPQGAFYLGDPDPVAQKFGAFYQSDGSGEMKACYAVVSENQVIAVGPEDGQLYYKSQTAIYQGDQAGPVPASFPKGVQPFYIMKYELTQGQYADFLNGIAHDQTQFRANFGVKNYRALRGTIDLREGIYFAGSSSRPCNFYSWDDAMAYADWAGLRPMTELEFTKACRGPVQPSSMQYPWGAQPKESVLRVVNQNDDLVMVGGMQESALTNANRHLLGASYYWVMDLAGSVWERVITIGDARGRAFTGQHGDGSLDAYGFANVADWPSGNRENGGFGFRGGGFYTHGQPYGIFNPYSPIAFRRFGAWSGGVRKEAYGGRFVRTSD